jgi:putative FmdB family regulatory protein
MPLYDFRCPGCGTRFEARVAVDARPSCPACGAPDAERLLSGFAGPFTVGLRGGPARRSNASRRAREEQRREGLARQREERRQRGE